MLCALVFIVVAVGASLLSLGVEQHGAHGAKALVFEELYAVGVSDNGPYEEIFGMYQSVALAKDGTLYIGDESAKEIRVFDGHGKHVTTFGREGRAPGEFLNLMSL